MRIVERRGGYVGHNVASVAEDFNTDLTLTKPLISRAFNYPEEVFRPVEGMTGCTWADRNQRLKGHMPQKRRNR